MKILITGASSGIGFEVAKTLAQKNHEVIITVHKEEQIEPTIKKCEELRIVDKISCFKLDITVKEDREKITKLDFDCLVNNAAIGVGGSMMDLSVDKIRENFETNVFSTIELSQMYAGHLFLEKKAGKIIFISSLASILPLSFLGSYCGTKASLSMMATCLKKEISWLTDKIKIKLVEPGFYHTGFNDVMLENKLQYLEESFFQESLEKITAKQQEIIHLLEHKDLTSIVNKIVKAIEDDSTKFKYRAPVFQVFIAKLYMLLMK